MYGVRCAIRFLVPYQIEMETFHKNASSARTTSSLKTQQKSHTHTSHHDVEQVVCTAEHGRFAQSVAATNKRIPNVYTTTVLQHARFAQSVAATNERIPIPQESVTVSNKFLKGAHLMNTASNLIEQRPATRTPRGETRRQPVH